MIVSGPATAYLGTPQARHKVEITSPDWKFVGYTSEIELNQENEYEDIDSYWDLSPKSYLSSQKTTVSFNLDQVDNKLYTIITGMPKPKTKLDKVKDVLRGR